jgi:hypothetical protein
VAFTLRVTSAGDTEEFSFESGEARLGRTADNDVVIKDPSSSRSHARVYEEGGRYFVEDMKSANGTKLNARALKTPVEIKNGDRIIIGDVTLQFSAPPPAQDTSTAPPDSTLDEGSIDPTQDPNATILKPPKDPNETILKGGKAPAAISRKSPPPRRSPQPDETGDESADDESPPDDEDNDPPDQTKDFQVPPPKAIARRNSSVAVRAPPESRGDTGEVDSLSAADRARERRELAKSGSGRAQLLWGDLPKPARLALTLLGGAALIGVLFVGGKALIPHKVEKKAETVELRPNGEGIPESYGLGDVDFERPDLKGFSFTYQSPTAIVGVLHYQASDCSKDEVSIDLNGQQLATIPPDTVDVGNRELEVVMPAAQLNVGDPNEIVFDNTNNPPGDDTWKIWNVWIEVIPIPRMSPEEAARRAKEDLDKAARRYEDREVGAMNLFRSWKLYRDAWLLLEATPDRPQSLLETAHTRMREVRPELDRKCASMLVDFQKEKNKRDPDMNVIRNILKDIGNHFEKEHPCYGFSRSLLRDLDSVE